MDSQKVAVEPAQTLEEVGRWAEGEAGDEGEGGGSG
jgi:hypothetical protein